ncbi:ribonuclease HII [Pengzhenrongella sicca]|uniref:Ribonuclease n=1 Tax=Pengzhenrongella sicca TaxID=2819238 RepID=A0A8A4ZEY4_9MICO|nr:ribonuclease HII [Pengzhenrongella sicca]QTE30550.1 ribonuclease HII [Pengzhenrongella sicca]
MTATTTAPTAPHATAPTAPHATAPTRAPLRPPTLRRERALLGGGALVVAGMDEVGRGALAGPVSVGVVAVDARTRACPRGVADSKLLSPAARTALLPALSRWGLARAVGHASPAEIDAVGIIAALRLAGRRALATLTAAIGPIDAVLLDGSHDWLTLPAELDLLLGRADAVDDARLELEPTVHVLIKADRTCASVAAASVLAKCERDALMTQLAPTFPAYGWAENKGYGSADHLAALRTHGVSEQHRRSWRLPLDG